MADPRRPAEPPVDRVIGALEATGPGAVQVALTPVPALFELYARWLYRSRERKVSDARERGERRPQRDRSEVDGAELRGGLDVQHRPLFFADARVIGPDRPACEAVAAALRAQGAENRLVERGTAIRQALFGVYDRRVARGEGNPLPSSQAGVYASTELPSLWQLPSIDLAAVPLARGALPRAPAGPAITRAADGEGLLIDAHGPVTIEPDLRRQNTAVPGPVEQGKTSFLVASVREDLRRERCAVIVLDPKGDAADAALSVVPEERACTVLDLVHPTCGFNPLAVDAAPDAIADAVVGAMRNLFDEGDIRASSDRYLRNAIIAALAHDRAATLWDAVRLLSVTPEGYAFRERVARHLRGLPEFKEVGDFFAQELAAQLRDARAMTTSKLDAPVNKAARILNSAAIKRVLQNTSLTVDFDALISGAEVLIAIVANEARNRRRAACRRAGLSLRVAAERTSGDAAPSPEVALLAGGDREALLVALVALDEREQAVIACRYLLDLSERETADVLGCRPGTVKSRLSRALERMRAQLELRPAEEAVAP